MMDNDQENPSLSDVNCTKLSENVIKTSDNLKPQIPIPNTVGFR